MIKTHDDLVAFISGFLTGGGYGSVFLHISLQDMIVQVPLKLLFSIVVAFIGGIAGLVGKDFYFDKIKPRLFKKK